MARPFRRTPGGYTASFEPAERDLIRELAEDVRALLRPADTTADGGTVDPLEALVGITENPTIPADSAVARLLPAASSDDEAAAATPNATCAKLSARTSPCSPSTLSPATCA